MTRPRLLSQSGSALVTALLVMTIMMTIGVALLSTVDTQQRESGRERTRESTFQLTEAVLNAQIYQLSSRWPACSTASCAAAVQYPPACTETSTDNDCPNATALKGAYSGVDYKAGETWTTQVRDDDAAKPDFYTDALLSQPSYDFNGDGYVWVRATSVLHGHRRTLVGLVHAEPTTLDMPHKTMVAGWFKATNSGNKVIIDNSGGYPPSEVVVRCAAAGTTPPVTNCADYQSDKSKGGQVVPENITFAPDQPTSIPPEALDSLRNTAAADGNYYAAGSCPNSLAGDQPGETVFIEDASSCSPFSSNADWNTAAKPGVVIIGKGQITINGTSTFYGVIYHANLDNVSNPARVVLGGNVSINGSIQVDGNGGIYAGSSKVNLVWNPNVFNSIRGFGTANIVQNTFREINATS